MAMYSIRSERGFCERLNYDLLFKSFLDMRIDQPAFDATTFTKNRQRLLEAEVADEFFATVVRQAKLRRDISSDHFSVDSTLLNARLLSGATGGKPIDGVRAGDRDPLGVAVRRGQFGVDDQRVAVLHQQVSRVAQRGGGVVALAIRPGLGVGGGGVGVVGALLAVPLHLGVAARRRIRRRRAVFGLKDLCDAHRVSRTVVGDRQIPERGGFTCKH